MPLSISYYSRAYFNIILDIDLRYLTNSNVLGRFSNTSYKLKLIIKVSTGDFYGNSIYIGICETARVNEMWNLALQGSSAVVCQVISKNVWVSVNNETEQRVVSVTDYLIIFKAFALSVQASIDYYRNEKTTTRARIPSIVEKCVLIVHRCSITLPTVAG